jgi:AcrR family transcriptional regulator
MRAESPPARKSWRPRNEEREDTTRRRILALARQHFLAHGVRSVTMDELAEELGMSKKTLYAHFASKAALVEAVIVDKLGEVEADLDRIAAAGTADLPGLLPPLLATVQRHTEELQPPFLRDLRREWPEISARVEGRRREMIRRCFTKLLDEGHRAGTVRRDVPVRVIIEILLGATQAVMNPPKLVELGLTPKAGLTSIIRVILEGVMTERRRPRR